MTKNRWSIAFKRQVAEEHLADVLGKRHDRCRKLVRIGVRRYADTLQAFEAKVAAKMH
jgi:hypothetical protein